MAGPGDGEGSGKAAATLFSRLVQATRQLMYSVTYLLAQLVGMGELSVLKLLCLPSDLQSASLCPGLDV